MQSKNKIPWRLFSYVFFANLGLRSSDWNFGALLPEWPPLVECLVWKLFSMGYIVLRRILSSHMSVTLVVVAHLLTEVVLRICCQSQEWNMFVSILDFYTQTRQATNGL
jgi:hypothetical protein